MMHSMSLYIMNLTSLLWHVRHTLCNSRRPYVEWDADLRFRRASRVYHTYFYTPPRRLGLEYVLDELIAVAWIHQNDTMCFWGRIILILWSVGFIDNTFSRWP
ncbi:hypothetical protein JOM56_000139 [Amanita muscaria]